MNSDALLIAQAILATKQNVDTFKDYIFPVMMAFSSAFVGGVVAYRFNLRQERIREERAKFSAVSKLQLKMMSCLNDLIAIKVNNFIDLDSDNPIQRTMSVGIILSDSRPVDFDFSSLSFIKSIPTANLPLNERISNFLKYRVLRRSRILPSAIEIGKSWRDLNRLVGCIGNFNYIYTILKERNVLRKEVEDKLHSANLSLHFTYEQLISVFEEHKLIKLVDLTEMLFVLTEFIINEINSFLKEFPDIAESNIELSLMGGGGLLRFSSDGRPLFEKALNPVVKPNYGVLSELMGASVEELKQRYTFQNPA
ncbi:MAG: hypothetical protein ACRCZ6_16565 [Kluyvera sp.]|uniref:hypothetical protein n=1 Tax=Kluyvera sp. TaxID=1538228 RepID=UPI003F399E23